MKLILHSDNLETTLAIGQAIGKTLSGGETIELDSDLGGGKTALTKGIAAGMGNRDTVQSPTFTISRIYQCDGGLELHHFDFYRLEDPGIMAAELAESVSDDRAVVVVEWSGIVADILPVGRITIRITATGETTRQLLVEMPDALGEKLRAALQKFTKESP
jgi:tRNA threonylcarbamoyladenosine biosynthesis protein TsaE